MRILMLAVYVGLMGGAGASGADWPMLRGDAARSGYSPEDLPADLSLVWQYQSSHVPQRAWPRSDRQQFDACYQPIVSDGRLFFGSSVDCKLYCLDAATGRPLWTYFTGGPIRFAPVSWKDRVAVASDDGYLYVLDAETGQLVWKHRGGPDGSMRLGNERMISKWPARGGPVLLDGIVYYAAGIWPSDGIFIYALDADTGKPLWSNKDSGSIYMPQPHGGANAESGVAAQGHLAAYDKRLFVPTGRAVPAALDRASGKLAYFHLQQNRAAGSTSAAVIGNYLFNSGIAFDTQTGAAVTKLAGTTIAALPGGIVSATANQVSGHRFREMEQPDRKGKPVKVTTLEKVWTAGNMSAGTAVIVAGTKVVAGGADRVTLLDGNIAASEKDDVAARPPLWTADVKGTTYGLAVANGRLYVSTDLGWIYCFAREGQHAAETVVSKRPELPTADNSIIADAADEIIRRTGITEGYCLDLGCGDGQLALELAKRTNLIIYSIDDDLQRVAEARQKLDAAGIYGSQVTVHLADLDATGYPTYFANLIVSSRSIEAGADAVPAAEVERLQRPFGGVACLGKPSAMQVSTRGALEGAGSWTHQYSNPANTVCSDDALIKGDLGMLWFRDVDLDLPSRHGRGPAPLFYQGRLLHEGLDEICAVDAYNGRKLWSYRLSGILKPYDGDHLMGTAGTGSNFCVSDEGVFARHDNSCAHIDTATGDLIEEFSVPGHDGTQSPWGYIAVADGKLFGSRADPSHVVTYRYQRGGDLSKQLTESNLLFAYDVQSGDLLWKYAARDSIRHNAIAIGAKYVYLIDRPVAAFDKIRSGKANEREHPPGVLLALDKETGSVVWRQENDIYGTTLAVSDEHQVLVMSYQDTRFKLASEVGGRLSGFDAMSGELKWDRAATYRSRLTINGRTIYADGGAWDLLTGEPRTFNLRRSYGCGVLSASKNMFFFRSATLGYFDLVANDKMKNFGGVRPGCWINAIPAGGLVLVPDASASCTCSYLNQSWFALEPLGKEDE